MGAAVGTLFGPAGTASGGILGGLFGGSHGTVNQNANGNPSNIAHMDAMARDPSTDTVAYLRGIALGMTMVSGMGTPWPWNAPSVNWGENTPARAGERAHAAAIVAAMTQQGTAQPQALTVPVVTTIEPVPAGPTTGDRISTAVAQAIQAGLVNPNDAAAIQRYAQGVADRAGVVASAATGAQVGAGIGATVAGVPSWVWGAALVGTVLMVTRGRRA